MRRLAVVGVVTGLTSLGCGLDGLSGVTLSEVSSTSCGTWQATATTKAPSSSRVVQLQVDGQPVEPMIFDAGVPQISVERSATPGKHTITTMGLFGADYLVDVRATEAGIDWPGWATPPRQGDKSEVELSLISPCESAGFELTAEWVEEQRTVASRQPLDAGMLTLDTTDLVAGTHTLSTKLYQGELLVEEKSFEAVVEPPCDGPECQDRDRDGFLSKAHGGEDCDDTMASTYPGSVSFPDPDGDGAVVSKRLDIDCDGEIEVFEGLHDCNEGDPTIPRPEDPDPTGVDEDCDGIIDENTIAYDDDGDGFSEEQGDCRDDDVAVHPKAREQPDCKDNNCDGAIDEGVTRPDRNDKYEPNTDRPYDLPGATPMRGFFGGYRGSSSTLDLIVGSKSDIETFEVFAHDGNADVFHVTATVLSLGDNLQYELSVDGPGGSKTTTVMAAGDSASVDGRGMKSDTGNYTIKLRPVGEHPPFCPVTLKITGG